MSEKRFTIKPQDDYWAVIDNHNDDKVCIINGIHTEIEAIWLCDFMNEQQSIIDEQKIAIDEMITDYKNLEKENEKLKKRNKFLEEDVDDYHIALFDLHKKYDKLEKENEQLKKRLSLYDEDEVDKYLRTHPMPTTTITNRRKVIPLDMRHKW